MYAISDFLDLLASVLTDAPWWRFRCDQGVRWMDGIYLSRFSWTWWGRCGKWPKVKGATSQWMDASRVVSLFWIELSGLDGALFRLDFLNRFYVFIGKAYLRF